MKKYKISIIILVMMLLCPISVKAKNVTDADYYNSILMLQEVMKAYYNRGPYLQYNYAKAQYNGLNPEEATSQDNRYMVCADFTYSVYKQAFGIDNPDGECMDGDNSFLDNFPKYNYHIIMAAQSEYKKIQAAIKAKVEYEHEGNELLYYESNTSEPVNPTTETNKEDGFRRDREVVRYIYDDKDTETVTGDLETLISNVMPGDLFVISGHALIAYDVVERTVDGKTFKDVLILNATGSGEIRTIIEGTSTLYYNMATRTNGVIDVNQEGGIKFRWLSEYSPLVNQTTKALRCHSNYEECAVVRPFYSEDTIAKFNFGQKIQEENYKKSQLRLENPGLYIEKTATKGDNNSVYIGDTITYTIKITNKSDQTWTGFYIQEHIKSYVFKTKTGEKIDWQDYVLYYSSQKEKEYFKWSDLKDDILYVSSSNNGSYDSETGVITWRIEESPEHPERSLGPGEEISLSYTIKLNNDVGLVGTFIESSGAFLHNEGDKYGVPTGNIDSKIIPKVTKLNDTYSNCYTKAEKQSLTGLDLINEIYVCATGKDFSFGQLDFAKIFTTSGTSKANAAINFKSTLDDNHLQFKDMILNNYFSGMRIYKKTDKNTGEVTATHYFLPRWTSKSNSNRARVINASDFREGDILVYYGLGADQYAQEGDSVYAYIYLDGAFKGINPRTTFTYDYYEKIEYKKAYITDDECTLGNDIACSYWGNLYGGYSKLTNNNLEKTLKFVNYQTLYGKKYYMILRPEQVIEEIVDVKLTPPSTTQYIQKYEELNLDDGSLEVSYNNGIIENIDLTDSDVKITGFSNEEIGQKTITVEYKGYIKTFKVEIVSKQATKIEIVTKPTKTKYIVNTDELDLTGGVIKVTYNDNSTDEISMTSSDLEVTGFDNKKAGTKTITITYQGHTAEFEVEVIDKVVEKISVKTLPLKLNYVENSEQLDLTGGVIKVTYTDGTESTVSMTNEEVVASGFDHSKIGKNTITLEYHGKTTTFEITIIEKQIEKIEVTTKPLKTTYIHKAEELDLTGGKITATYNDGSTDIINMTNKEVKASGFDNSEVKTITITIEYQGRSAAFDVEIISKVATKIVVSTLPLKTLYVKEVEELDLTGGVIKVTYNDGSESAISMTNSEVKATGFDNKAIGVKTITVRYQELSTTFDVEIIEKQITKIEVKTQPTKTQYVQNVEKLDLTGGVIKVTYNDGSESAISMTNSEVKATGFSNKTLGIKTITIEYQGQSTTYSVEIIARQVIGIEIKEKPYKSKYVQNSETLDLSGGIITAKYNDKSTDEISMTNESVKVSGFDNSVLGKQTITVEYLGYQETFTVEIISKQIVKIEVTETPTDPKLYIDQEQLDLKDGVITVTYNDGTTNTVSMTSDDIKIVSFDKKELGKQTIILSYLGHSFTIDVEVVEGIENPSTGDSGSMIIAILLTLIVSLFAYTKIKQKQH